MKNQLIGFTLLFFSCVLMPLVAEVDLDVHMDILDDLERAPRPGESMTITVDVQEDGSPVEGETVTFSVSPDDGSASLSTTSATTDSNGEAQTTLTFGSDSSGRWYEIRVAVDDDPRSMSGFSVETVSDGAVFKLYINYLRTYSPGESVAFTASLRKDGKGVPSKTVTFSLSPDDGTASLSTTSGTTDSNGDVGTKVVLGSNASGSYSVTATLDDGTSESNGMSVYNPTPPDFYLDMSIPRGAIPVNPGESRTFIAIAKKDGNYVSGKTVTFSVSPDDGTVSLSPTTATTGSDGQASTSLMTGSGSSGSYTVTASGGHGTGISISGTVTVEASLPPPTDPNPDPPEINPIPEVAQIPQEQRAAPEGSTGNTSLASTGSTGNTPGTPRSVFVVSIPVVSKTVLDSGESFTLSVTVENTGEGLSPETILRFYRGSDIGVSGTEVGKKTLSPIAAMGTSDVSISLTAPDAPGTYLYYACISSVTGESNTGNHRCQF